MTMNLRQLHPRLGAEVTGITLGAALDDAAIEAIRAAWVEHCVLVFRNQKISDEDQIAFSRRFGDLEIFPQSDNRSSSYPEIFRLANVDEYGRLLPIDDPTAQFVSVTQLWHTDSCYREIPCAGAILHGICVTETGGETHFADLRAAYDTLPDATRKRIAHLKGRHSFEYMRGHRDLPPMKPEERALVPPVVHPLVRTHPVSGRQSLYISPVYMEGVEGLPDAAAKALIAELTEWATRPEFVYRHQWRRDDVLMWDNRSTMHVVTPFNAAEVPRIMHRTTLVGTGPVV